MPKKTIRLDGKKHSIPKCFLPLISELENIEGVTKVETGRFWCKGSSNKLFCKVQYYDLTRRRAKILAFSKEFREEFYLIIDPQMVDKVNNYFQTHYPNVSLDIRLPLR